MSWEVKSMIDDLKPCPFCGSAVLKMYKTRTAGHRGNGAHSVYIKCQKCHARGPKVAIGIGDDPEKELTAAAGAWNNRI